MIFLFLLPISFGNPGYGYLQKLLLNLVLDGENFVRCMHFVKGEKLIFEANIEVQPQIYD